MKFIRLIPPLFLIALMLFVVGGCSSNDNGIDDDENIYGKPHTYRFVMNGGGYSNQEFKGEIENKYYEDDDMKQSATGNYYTSEGVEFIHCLVEDGEDVLITAAFIMSGSQTAAPLGEDSETNSQLYIVINNAGESDTEAYESVSGTVTMHHLETAGEASLIAPASFKVDFEGIFEGGLLVENEKEPVQISGTIQINLPVQID